LARFKNPHPSAIVSGATFASRFFILVSTRQVGGEVWASTCRHVCLTFSPQGLLQIHRTNFKCNRIFLHLKRDGAIGKTFETSAVRYDVSTIPPATIAMDKLMRLIRRVRRSFGSVIYIDRRTDNA
jgi:hypothetical protein